MIKAVIFDLDGTLCDTLSTIAHYGNLSLEYNGFKPIDTEEYKYFAGDGKVTLIHRMLAYHNADTEQNFCRVERKYDYEYEQDNVFETKPFDGVLEMLENIKKKGIKTAVLSNKPDNVTVPIVYDMFGELIDTAHGKRDGIEKKPNPEGVYLLLDEMGVSAKECLFVGDTNVDIITAKNSYIKSVGVLWGFRDEAELTDAGADFLAKTPKELENIIVKMKMENE